MSVIVLSHELDKLGTVMNIIQDSVTFAFRGGGKYTLLIGAVLGLVAELVSLAPLIGFIAYVFLFGYFCSIYFSIIESSASGNDEAPEYPEATNIVSDILWPALQVVGVLIVCLAPVLLYEGFVDEGKEFSLLGQILMLGGIAYFPMAMLAVVLLNSMTAMSPNLVIPSIWRAGALYWLAVLLLIGLYYFESVLMGIFGGVFILSTVISCFLGMYVLMTNARIIGLLFRERQEEINWF